MNRLFITSIVLLSMTFSQEIDSSLVDNKQVLNTSIQNPDSLIVDTLEKICENNSINGFGKLFLSN